MSDINYMLLETARLLRQKTQKEVAEATGVPQSILSKAEHGLIELAEENFLRLCDYYDFPKGFFFREVDYSQLGYLYYRKKLTLSKKVVDSFISKVKIFRWIIDDLAQSVEIPEYVLSSYVVDDQQTVQDIAQKVRYELGVFHGPVPCLSTLLENNGIIIVNFDFGTEKIDGLTVVTPGNRKLMFINSRMPNDRIRFSMAHELGHLVMHFEHTPLSEEEAERQADEFASEFLMPEMEIRPMLRGLNTESLSILKRRWRVSMHALVRRAFDLDIIDYQKYRSFQISFSKKGYTKEEPIQLPIDSPSMLREILKLYQEELQYSDNDLMRVMRINPNDYWCWFKESVIYKPKFKFINFES